MLNAAGSELLAVVPTEKASAPLTVNGIALTNIPLDYLRELFGPGAEKALAKIDAERKKAASGKKSELIDILIARDWQQLLGPYPQDPAKLQRPPKK